MAVIFFSQRNKPRKFGYLPRYYDPEQEARQERRKQLRAADGKPIEMEEYKPGSIIRSQGFRARSGRQRKSASGRPLRLVIIIVALIVVAYFVVRWQMNLGWIK